MAKGYFEPLAIKLAIGAIIVVVGTLAPAFYYLADRHYRGLLELKAEESLAHGDLIRTILEHEMLEGNLDLVRELVERYSDDPSNRRIMLLDHLGRVRFSNDPSVRGRTFSRASPACQVCHEKAPAERESSALVELSHGTILRGVYPVRNREACHACHGPSIDINGVVIADTNISRMQAELRADTRNMAVAVAAVALALLAGMGLLVRRLVLRRLQKIVTSARAIAAGDFSRRVDIGGDDALARLGSEFNAMADATNNLLNQLHDHRTQLENVMNSVDDGLLVLDDTFTVVAANRAAAQRIDAPREQLLFRRCRDLWGEQCVCGSSGAGERCPSQRCFESGRSQTAFVTRIGADGVERQEEVSVSPVFAHDGRVTQVVEVWRDITERKSHEARMAEFQRLASVGTLASGFSHEVNTPLGTVLLCVDDITGRIATRLPDAADEIRGQLRLIRDEILRCRALTQQFLQLSKGQSLKRDLVEIRALVGNTIPLVEHIAKDADVAVRILPSREVGLVSANPGAAQQVLLNLLLNAVQASEPGGEVRVSWDFNGSVIVRVEDDGVGMPVEVRRNIFEPFYSRRPSGTGLGLFVSINLARHWGGDIRVESRPGLGSSFEVTFPHQDSQ